MKSKDYIEKVVSKIANEELRSRIREELGDHWEDYCENKSSRNTPKEVFGDETLLAQQTNAVALPGMFWRDIILSIVCCAFTLIVFLMLSTFLTLDLNGGPANKIITIAISTAGFIFWSAILGCVYLAVQRRYIVRYSRSIRRIFLTTIALIIPVILIVVESFRNTVRAFSANAPYSIFWQLFSDLLVLLIICGLFLVAGWMVSSKITSVNQIIGRLRRYAPLITATIVTFGIAVLTMNGYSSASNSDSLMLAGMPFTLPLLVLYLFWGLATNTLGSILHIVDAPTIFSYLIIVMFVLLIGIAVPVILLLLRKQIPFSLQLVLGIILPLIIILPIIPKDVPDITWNVPTVWTWDNLEQKQLNIAYPWATSLMRRNDGINVGYGAYLSNGKITVAQEGGANYVITRGGVTRIESTPGTMDSFKSDGYIMQGDIPVGFTCDARSVEEFIDTHNDSTGPLGMFGIQCNNLAFNGVYIATIDYGSLIDLDVSDDGLLAVSINMGSYDPTYVYVVEI